MRVLVAQVVEVLGESVEFKVVMAQQIQAEAGVLPVEMVQSQVHQAVLAL
jgi:hypothetical protein